MSSSDAAERAPDDPGTAAPAVAADSLHELLAQLRLGDEQTARLLFERYAQRLIALAAARLESVLRRHVDPTDVAQSALRSFFSYCGWRKHQSPELQTWEDVWALLVCITERKCRNQWQRLRRNCRDVNRDVSGEAAEVSLGEALSREPSPEEAGVAAELLERLLEGLSDRDRLIVDLKFQRQSVKEIEERTGSSQRTIFRVLSLVRAKAQDLEQE